MRCWLGKNFTLGGNIDATVTRPTAQGGNNWNSGAGFVPIGNNTSNFTGNFNGNGYTISNLYIYRTTSYVGLFGYASSSAKLSNIGLLNESISGGIYLGGLVGYDNGGSISNCYTTGNVTMVGSIPNVNYIGGLVGNNFGSITNSYSTANVSGGTRVGSYVGGLVGRNNTNGSITNSYATGSVSNSHVSTGGLVGNNSGSITNSYATGDVIGGQRAGGLAGDNSGFITYSYATGNVSGYDRIGGLVGWNSGNSIANSYATGNMDGNGGQDVGGLVGENEFASISNSYATGNVSNTVHSAGGFLGLAYNGGSFINCYSTGNVNATSDNDTNLNGFVGTNISGTYTNDWYYNGTTYTQPTGVREASGYSDFYGTGSGTGGAVYTGWDFSLIWLANSGTYPTIFVADVWSAPSAGNWSTASNWSLGVVPTAMNRVIFNDTSTQASIVDSGFSWTVGELDIYSGYTDTVTLNSSLNVTTLSGGTGLVAISSGTLDIGSYTLTVTNNITGSGTIEGVNPTISAGGYVGTLDSPLHTSVTGTLSIHAGGSSNYTSIALSGADSYGFIEPNPGFVFVNGALQNHAGQSGLRSILSQGESPLYSNIIPPKSIAPVVAADIEIKERRHPALVLSQIGGGLWLRNP